MTILKGSYHLSLLPGSRSSALSPSAANLRAADITEISRVSQISADGSHSLQISADCQRSHLTSERLDTLLSLLLTGLGESCLVLDLGPGLGLGLEMTSGLGESCLVLDLGPGLRLGLTSDMTSAVGLGLTEGDGLMETCGEQTLTSRVRLIIQQTLEKTILREASSAGDSFLVLLFLTL